MIFRKKLSTSYLQLVKANFAELVLVQGDHSELRYPQLFGSPLNRGIEGTQASSAGSDGYAVRRIVD